MSTRASGGSTAFRIIDAMPGPHSGWLIRLRLDSGAPPAVGSLKGSRWIFETPRGERGEVDILGFPTIAGKVSDARLKESGRIDLHVDLRPGGLDVIPLRSILRPA